MTDGNVTLQRIEEKGHPVLPTDPEVVKEMLEHWDDEEYVVDDEDLDL